MKKLIVFLLAAGSWLSLAAQPVRYQITGRIKWADGEKFILQRLIGGKPVKVDSAISLKGVFKMNAGSVEFPEMVNLTVPSGKQNVMFFLENREITIEGKLDSLNKAIITGSKTQDELMDYRARLTVADERRVKLASEFQAANEALMKEVKAIQIGFIKDHPGSYAVPQLLRTLLNDIPGRELESIVKAMDSSVTATPVMKEIITKMDAEKDVAIGVKAPDFTLNDVNNVPIALSSLQSRKLLLIDFWAAWCKPCRVESPNLVRIYHEFYSKGFDILGVSLDRKKADWLKAVADDKLIWTQVSDLLYFSSPVAKRYKVTSIPANYLLDENGVIVAKNLRGEELYNKVKSVLTAE